MKKEQEEKIMKENEEKIKKENEKKINDLDEKIDFLLKLYEDMAGLSSPISSNNSISSDSDSNKKMEEDSVSTITSDEDKKNVSDVVPSELLTPDQSPISSPEAKVTPTPQQSPIMRPNRVQMSKKPKGPTAPSHHKLSTAKKRKTPEFKDIEILKKRGLDFEIPKKKCQRQFGQIKTVRPQLSLFSTSTTSTASQENEEALRDFVTYLTGFKREN